MVERFSWAKNVLQRILHEPFIMINNAELSVMLSNAWNMNRKIVMIRWRLESTINYWLEINAEEHRRWINRYSSCNGGGRCIVQCSWSVLGAQCIVHCERDRCNSRIFSYKTHVFINHILFSITLIRTYIFKKNGRYNGMDVLWYYYTNSLSSTNYEVMQWWYSSSLSYFLFWKLFYYIPTTVISISMCHFSHKLGQIHPNQLDKYDIDFIFRTKKPSNIHYVSK